MSKPVKIVILGGGPAGCTAAWKLSEQGYLVELIEKDAIIGGLSSTVRKNGYIFDLGGHRFISKDLKVLNEIKNLLGSELKPRARKSVIRLRGKYFHYPLEPLDLLMKMNPVTSLSCFADFAVTTVKNKLKTTPDISLHDWIAKRFGTSLYNIYFGPYSEKLWGVSPDKISADWASQRISLLNLWDVILHLFWKGRDKPVTYATRYLYPERGIGQICERMAEIIQENRGRIYTEMRVTRLQIKDGKVIKIIGESKTGIHEFEADFFLSTIPLPELLLSLEPTIPESLQQTCDLLSFRSLRFLNIMIDREQISNNNWIYIPEDRFTFFRIQEPKNWSETNTPPGKTSLILEIACNYRDEIWNLADKTLFTRCLEDLSDLGFKLKESEIEGYFSTFAQHAYPKYLIGYKQRIKDALEEISRCSNLLSFGRQGLFRYNNMDHSVKMGMVASEIIMNKKSSSKLYDIGSGQEYFETDETLKDLD
ncbi:MAG: hypothetical protein A2161_11025 [Candidatus Schekmanbacteria bacterium RBG_13_48_7]|uniref:Amine oxidase domain-containing protein n=1 Tax=Candidatus Schekmanbacteria bacterium RBG_13_48_7 TaxID=1817878 RepID=A0A1F7S8N6_9BACT|nr:MAG: hypothetical protein A2161_11025 [Candidatus Schekmanbacteria bacterium RBG_13_48_7]